MVKDYSVLSDFEINKLVAEKEGWLVKREVEDSLIGFNYVYHENYPNTVWCAPKDESGKQGDSWRQINCCHSWADMGPIIERERIDLCFSEIVNSAHTGDVGLEGEYEFSCFHKNPLRAAAIVYLMMGDE